MDQTFMLKYLAEKILQDIREEKPIVENVCQFFTGHPNIDFIRKQIKPEDAQYLINYMQLKTTSNDAKFLVMNLFHPIIDKKEVQKFLFNLWNNTSDYATKRALVWSLTNLEALPQNIHESMYNFVKQNWKIFIDGARNYVKGDTYDYAIERLGDERFPQTKAWLYLCVASTSNKKDDYKNLLDRYEKSQASIVSMVVKELKCSLATT